jgi:hypothetical protein
LTSVSQWIACLDPPVEIGEPSQSQPRLDWLIG